MKDKTLIAYDSDTVVIGFINSSDELEYSVYILLDGGSVDPSSDFHHHFEGICMESLVDTDIQEVVDVK